MFLVFLWYTVVATNFRIVFFIRVKLCKKRNSDFVIPDEECSKKFVAELVGVMRFLDVLLRRHIFFCWSEYKWTNFSRKDFTKLQSKKELEKQKINPDDLAERHAIKMLDEITNIVDSQLSSDVKIEKILKILVFCKVPPHI